MNANQEAMKMYMLLRDAKESGPYSFEEIISLSLKKSDLIWIEGQSDHWEYASKYEDIKPHIVSAPPAPVYIPSTIAPRERIDFKYKPFVEIPGPAKPREKRAAISTTINGAIPELKKEQPLPEFKERYIQSLEDKKFEFSKRSRRNSGAWIMALMFMLIGSAFVMQELIDTNEGMRERKPVAAAVPLVGLPEGKIAEKQADVMYKNAISMEVSATDTIQKTGKKISLKEVKRKVSINVNKYKVGMFGGVDDLQLNVHNGSNVTIDKVNIQVTFLKSGGEEVNASTHSVYSLEPGSTKILVVPPSKRGVKVKYQVTGIESKQPSVSQI